MKPNVDEELARQIRELDDRRRMLKPSLAFHCGVRGCPNGAVTVKRGMPVCEEHSQ